MSDTHELDPRCESHKALGYYYDPCCPCCPFCPEDPELDHAQRHGHKLPTRELEDGFYWVKWEGVETVAHLTRGLWFLPGNYGPVLSYEHFDEIDPRPIVRPE